MTSLGMRGVDGYTVSSAVGFRSAEVVTMPDLTSIVFVVDDDVSVRESLELLIKSAGWRAETFASGQDFLSRPRVGRSLLRAARCHPARAERPRAAAAARGAHRHADHLHHRTRRHTHDRPGDESRSRRVPDETVATRCARRLRFAAPSTEVEPRFRLDSEMQALRNCYQSLTSREREVMALVVSGLLNKQVGGELGISEITVKVHRGHVMRKMKADSLPHLVTMAARLGVLCPAPITLSSNRFVQPPQNCQITRSRDVKSSGGRYAVPVRES